LAASRAPPNGFRSSQRKAFELWLSHPSETEPSADPERFLRAPNYRASPSVRTLMDPIFRTSSRPPPARKALQARIGAQEPRSGPAESPIEATRRAIPTPKPRSGRVGTAPEGRSPEAPKENLDPTIQGSQARWLNSPVFVHPAGAAKTGGSFEPISVPIPASLSDQTGFPISDLPAPRHAYAWEYVRPVPGPLASGTLVQACAYPLWLDRRIKRGRFGSGLDTVEDHCRSMLHARFRSVGRAPTRAHLVQQAARRGSLRTMVS
jgi:hypothetical protein